MPDVLVAVHSNGTLEYTRDKRLYGFFENQGEMIRVTDICKFKHSGEYYFIWTAGPYSGLIHSHGVHEDIYGTPTAGDNKHAVFVFDTYEDAVRYEREAINALRKLGVRFSK